MGLALAWLHYSLHVSLSNSFTSGLVSWPSEEGDWASRALRTSFSLNVFTSISLSCQCYLPVHQCSTTWPDSFLLTRCHTNLQGESKGGEDRERKGRAGSQAMLGHGTRSQMGRTLEANLDTCHSTPGPGARLWWGTHSLGLHQVFS